MTKSKKVESVAELSYADSMAEIEKIVAELQREDCDIDTLAERTRRAVTLIENCRQRLRRSQEEVEKLLSEE
ncbi:MAG: exodeoxyribonuclease VII small subunit [Alistipes sp.]|nr:exodeoxyribonuclease VII small subunit [Alistipes sp.]